VGGDELFGGYRKYQAHYLAQKYQQIPTAVRSKILEPLLLALPAFHGTVLHDYIRLAKKMARSGSLPSRKRFLTDSVYLNDVQKSKLYSPIVNEQLRNIDPLECHLKHFDRVAEADFLNQMLYVDCKTFMVSLNLNYNDKMSMASSVEVRVPFLDWELAEWVAWNVPPDFKLHSGVSKHILRLAMQPVLPDEVLRQRKAGFGAPAAYWIKNDLKEMINDLLSADRLKARGLFNISEVQRFISEHMTGRNEWALQIWQLLTLELWQQQFLD
jgi:asparagine synthase (glutamine-hydrolysing)